MQDSTWQILHTIASSFRHTTAQPFDQLAEEVMELHLAMRGKHPHTPCMEWLEIATIAMGAFGEFSEEEQQAAWQDWRDTHSLHI